MNHLLGDGSADFIADKNRLRKRRKIICEKKPLKKPTKIGLLHPAGVSGPTPAG
ncbi:hypothetical protein HU762_16815 [Pseudomonas sp. SWRI92]|uniref:Uncharacterized protein n=1 Tax=Pseudomonas marvdashtae TaxID=2745500 RepID=A0A923FRT1_9PSED|nr:MULTISPECIES: hypothetical protein [Pseudomonas]MBC3375615.1 hypothetical protein [Pseudomonas sp. SWRI92]MBV4554742.1 hypothetical protein [Pseudomonas marvdashtae]